MSLMHGPKCVLQSKTGSGRVVFVFPPRLNDVSSEAESSLAFRQFEVMYFGAYCGEQFVIVYGGYIYFFSKDCKYWLIL